VTTPQPPCPLLYIAHSQYASIIRCLHFHGFQSSSKFGAGQYFMDQNESPTLAERPTHRTLPPTLARVINLLYRSVRLSFKFLFSLVINHFFALIKSVLITSVVSAFAATFLYFLHREYYSFKQATLAVPVLLVSTAFNMSSTLVMFSYCRFPFSPQWGCPRPPLFPDKVIGGMIEQVDDARDIFEMITRLGRKGSDSVSGSSSIQYIPLSAVVICQVE
jgi:hypothetical protein